MKSDHRVSYPLRWPFGRPRQAPDARRSGQFKVTLARARDALLSELRKLGAKDVVITSDLPVRRDGLFHAGSAPPRDPGVAVYFEWKGRQYVFACDTFTSFLQNLRAVGKTVESIRAIERYGATEMMEQAFTGFAALPEAGRSKPWWEVLGLTPAASRDQIAAAHRELALIHHPDKAGGSFDRMAEINVARDEALGASKMNGATV